MEKTMQIIKRHKWAVIFAILAAIIIAFPQVYFRYDNRDAYQGIELLIQSPCTPWIREALDGHSSLGSIYLRDGKNDPYIFQPLGAAMVAFLGKIFFLDFNNTLLLSRLFFSFLVFLLMYGFVFLLSKDKLTALASSVMFFLGGELVSRSGLWQILAGQSPRPFLYFFRPLIPILPALFFFAFLLFFWLFLERKQWRWGVASAATLGLSFYNYFYDWTFLYAFCGVLLLIFLFQRKWQDVKRIAAVLLGGAVISIPYFLNLWQASIHPTYQEMMQRFGIIETRSLISLGFLVPIVFIVALLFFPKKYKKRFFFVLSLAAAPFIVLQQQLITGKIMQSGHYHWRYHTPLAIIILLVIFFSWVSRRKWEFFKKASAFLIIAVSIYTGIFMQSVSYTEAQKVALEQQRYGPVMKWLNTNGQKEEVVFGNNEVSYFVSIYTPMNVFHHMGAAYALAASHERLVNNLFALYRLEGVAKDKAEEVFFQERRRISGRIYGLYYRELLGTYQSIPDEVLQEFVQKYQESLSIPNNEFLNELWSKYQVKYLVWDKKNNPQWQLDQYDFLEKAAEIGDLAIYQK